MLLDIDLWLGVIQIALALFLLACLAIFIKHWSFK